MDNTHRSFFRSLMSVRRCDISPAFPLSCGMVDQEGGPLPCRATDKVQYQLSIDFKSNVPQNYF